MLRQESNVDLGAIWLAGSAGLYGTEEACAAATAAL